MPSRAYSSAIEFEMKFRDIGIQFYDGPQPKLYPNLLCQVWFSYEIDRHGLGQLSAFYREVLGSGFKLILHSALYPTIYEQVILNKKNTKQNKSVQPPESRDRSINELPEKQSEM